MGEAIRGSLPLAVAIAVSPVPIIAVVLILTSRRAKVNGPAFIAGWPAWAWSGSLSSCSPAHPGRAGPSGHRG